MAEHEEQRTEADCCKRVSSVAESAGTLLIRAHAGQQCPATPASPAQHSLMVSTSRPASSQSSPRSRAESTVDSQSVGGSPPLSPSSLISSPGSSPAIHNPYQNEPPSQRYFRNALREAQGNGHVSRSMRQRFVMWSRSCWNNAAKVRAMLCPGREDMQMTQPTDQNEFTGYQQTRTASSLVTEYALCMLDVGRAIVAPKARPLPVRYLSANFN